MTYDRPDLHRYSSDAERRHSDRRRLGAAMDLTARQRRRLRVGAGVLAILIAVGAWALVAEVPGNTAEARPVDDVEVDGRTLILHWSSAGCETVNSERTEVRETAETVHLILYVDIPTAGCPQGGDLETDETYEVTLDQPLDGRNVIDEACLLAAYACPPDHPDVDEGVRRYAPAA